MKISGLTQVYGIIGDPVAHSLSPLFQNFFIKSSLIDACYMPFSVAPESLNACLDGLRLAGVCGLNITIPHKQTVYAATVSDTTALKIGAVNTIKNAGDHWLACNTDYLGVLASLQGLQADVSDTLIFGAGGTAYAVIHALALAGAKHLTLVNRTRSKAESLQQHTAKHYPEINCKVIDWQQEAVCLSSEKASTCINCSSIGLHDGDVFPFALAGEGTAMDVVYRPDGNTAFYRATKQTRRCTDGLAMLVAQGAASFAWWHGGTPPDCMRCLQWLEQQLPRPRSILPGWV